MTAPLSMLDLSIEQREETRKLVFRIRELENAARCALNHLRSGGLTPAERVLQQAIGEGK